MALLTLFVVFLVLMLMGAPVALAMGIASVGYLAVSDLVPTIMVVRMVDSLGGLTLLAIPFFVLAGEVMNQGGITERIFGFASKLVGHVRGGLGHVNILSSMFFAGISGSAVADAAGLGRIEIKAMRAAGYQAPFSAAVTAASSCIGPIIPPSILMVIFGTMADVSIPGLFIGGIVPGILLGLFMMVYVSWVAHREDFPRQPRARFAEIIKSFFQNVLALGMPVVIIAGLVFGIVTPTEAGVAAVLYALAVAALYGELKFRSLGKILEEALISTSQILFILSCSALFGWLVTTEQIPERLAEIFLASSQGQVFFLLAVNIILLFLGTFMSLTAILVIFTPALLSMATALAIDPIHLGVVVVLNLTIGLITPPLGWCLYIVTEIAEIKFIETARAIVPFLIPLLGVLFLITYVPEIVLWPVDVILSRE
jgi:C4-dicarboxylate transporter, DctM subunit